MGDMIVLTAGDGHQVSAYRSGTQGPRLVLIQEIFGVNGHIRNTADRFATQGFRVIAPALFDRIEPGIELGYGEEDIARGRDLKGKVADDDALQDIAAACDLLAEEGAATGCVGYCWGGALAWAAATRMEGFGAAVGYYGGGIANTADATPNCPVMLHFGEKDHAIPIKDVERIKAAQPKLPIHIYPAGHGFSCDERGSYDSTSHELALSRTLPFLRENLER